VAVSDAGSGLNVSSAAYRYSVDGVTWSDWTAAPCTGANGTNGTEQITAFAVPFNRFYSINNLIQFRVGDTAGNMGTSPTYRLYILR
jgi:hypothetical protein